MDPLGYVIRAFLFILLVFVFLSSFGLPNPEHPLILQIFELVIAMAASVSIIRINECLWALAFGKVGNEDDDRKDAGDGE